MATAGGCAREHLTLAVSMTDASVTVIPARTSVSTMQTVSISSLPSATGTRAVGMQAGRKKALTQEDHKCEGLHDCRSQLGSVV